MGNARACLALIASFYNKQANVDALEALPELAEENVGWFALSRAAERVGFRAKYVKLTFRQLSRDVALPCIVQWEGQNEFAVLFPMGRWYLKRNVKCACPPTDALAYTKDEFLRRWVDSKTGRQAERRGVLLLEPTFRFQGAALGTESKLNWRLVLQYFRRSHWQIVAVIFAFMIVALIQLTIPFLLQSIVDVGINTKDINYIGIIVVAQLVLLLSRVSVDVIRGRLLSKLSIMINLSILSDFWIKLTHLPVAYFDQQHTGGLIQRISDSRQVQTFITGSAVNTVFSLINFVVFAIALTMLRPSLFIIFSIGMLVYCFWMWIFLRIRKKMNYRIFDACSIENNATLQMIQGMQEIRLQNIEQPLRWQWEDLQISIFRLTFRNFTYAQLQQTGALMISNAKDFILTFIVARLVITGDLTFGAMLAVQYIIGQMGAPVEQFISFVQNAQDAKISMDRMNEVYRMNDEENSPESYTLSLPPDRTIRLSNLSFTYPGSGNESALNNINLEIPEGKTTAIVGVSGSGKTTLLKLLLRFYEPHQGMITVGEMPLGNLSPSFWRKQCGAVFQDGFIFNDTIGNNISLAYEEEDRKRLIEACRMSNLLSFIRSLPDGFRTRLGAGGIGISQGQKQRLLIARAIYKDPAYLFFDESTNALDSNNEKVIVDNLQEFFKGRTVVVVAHRLSTVKNADKIVVLHKGRIIEQGDHHMLASLKGKYFELVKNQLELGT